MKAKVIFLLLPVAVLCIDMSAQCPSGRIELTDQASIDNFKKNYPGCTTISNELVIGNATSFASITNLDGLKDVTGIGSLKINRVMLTSLSGLKSLRSLGNISIAACQELRSLKGLESINSLNHLAIYDCPKLSDLKALSHLTTVKSVAISRCGGLTSLSGLENIEPSGLSTLDITNNAKLTYCALKSICGFLQRSSATIEGNALHCNSMAEIKIICTNNPPTDIRLTSHTIKENKPPNSLVGILQTDDPNGGDIHVYSLVPESSNADNKYFTIADKKLYSNISFDYEARSQYTIRVRSTDQAGSYTEKDLEIDIKNENEGPVDLKISNVEIQEKKQPGQGIATFATSDPDKDDSFAYSLAAGDGDQDNILFSLRDRELFALTTFDAKKKNRYRIRVRVTDSGGLQFTKAFVLAIIDTPQPPSVVSDTVLILENSVVDTPVHPVQATDPDNDIVLYAIAQGNDRQAFQISPSTGLLSIARQDPLNFEMYPTHNLIIEVTDARGAKAYGTVVVTLTDVNESPTQIQLSSNFIDEGEPLLTPVGILSAVDQDGGDTHAYSLVSGSGDADNSFFSIEGDQLFSAQIFDFESRENYNIRVRATDAGGLHYEQNFTIFITNKGDENKLFIPNTFSPNDDSVNDFLVIHNTEEIAEISLIILNRSGEVVYSTHHVSEITSTGWDGTYHGKKLPVGTYLWKISGEFKNGQFLHVNGRNSGEVSLIR